MNRRPLDHAWIDASDQVPQALVAAVLNRWAAADPDGNPNRALINAGESGVAKIAAETTVAAIRDAYGVVLPEPGLDDVADAAGDPKALLVGGPYDGHVVGRPPGGHDLHMLLPVPDDPTAMPPVPAVGRYTRHRLPLAGRRVSVWLWRGPVP